MSLELSLGLGDRRRVVFVAAELAILAVERGDRERAGCLWGAVESEVSPAPVAEWEGHHQELESLVLRADSPEFSEARRGQPDVDRRGGRPRRPLTGSVLSLTRRPRAGRYAHARYRRGLRSYRRPCAPRCSS
jgi:hypothetical protein